MMRGKNNMAKKLYAVRIGRTPGIYTTWDEAKAQVDGFTGARYKGFTSMAEAEAFMKGTDAPKVESATQTSLFDMVDSASKSDAVQTDIVSPSQALINLRNVKAGGKNGISIQSAQVIAACQEKSKLLEDAFEAAYSNPVDVAEFAGRDDVQKLMAKYAMDFSDSSCFDAAKDFDAIAFVDGGGDKVGANFESTRIVFGAVIFDSKAKEISFYRYVLEKGTDFDWLFRASNVAGEELAALLSMYICKKKGLGSLAVYQDNNLPAKYYSGAFKAIHNMDDVALMYFINKGIEYLENDLAINFIYVPSEHAASANKAKMQKGKQVYQAQNIARLSFENALFFNGISDRLADYNIV
jgi:viroplasmin and RNaseH domain-containing protein